MKRKAMTLTETEISRRAKLTETNKNNKGRGYYERYNITDDNIDMYFVVKICKYCGKENKKWKTHNRSDFCNDKCKLKYMKKYQPLEYKAHTLFGCIPLGKGKGELSVEILKKYLNTNCKYCNEILTLKNISLDHKIPVHWKKENRKNPLIGDINNIHLICRKCNQSKRDLNDEQYLRLLEFLNKNIDIK